MDNNSPATATTPGTTPDTTPGEIAEAGHTMALDDLSPLRRQVGLGLQLAARAWRKRVDAALAGIGLSEAAGWALLSLRQLGDGAHLALLADSMEIEGPSASRLVESLVTSGLVRRYASQEDRRIRVLSLTAAGHEICRRMEPLLAGVRNDLLDGVSQADLEVLIRVCQQVQARRCTCQPPATGQAGETRGDGKTRRDRETTP